MPHDDDPLFGDLDPETQAEFLALASEQSDWVADQQFQIEEIITSLTSDPISVPQLRAALTNLFIGGE